MAALVALIAGRHLPHHRVRCEAAFDKCCQPLGESDLGGAAVGALVHRPT